MAKSMILHFFAGALADFPSPEDADHVILGACSDGLWYRRAFGGSPVPLEGVPASHFKARANVALVAGVLVVNFVALGLTNEPDTNYTIKPSCNADEVIHWESKATTGFTLRSSNDLSTALVDWEIKRVA